LELHEFEFEVWVEVGVEVEVEVEVDGLLELVVLILNQKSYWSHHF